MAFGHDQFVHHEQGSKVVNYLASPAINGLSRRAFAQADSVLWGDSFVSCHMHGYRAGKSTLSKSQYNQLIFHNSFRIHLRVIVPHTLQACGSKMALESHNPSRIDILFPV